MTNIFTLAADQGGIGGNRLQVMQLVSSCKLTLSTASYLAVPIFEIMVVRHLAHLFPTP